MPNLTLSIPHQLSRAEARRRIEEQLAALERQHGQMVGPIERRWDEDTLHFSVDAVGQTVSGQVAVEDQVVRVEVALPWMLAMLAGTMKQQIEQQGRVLLEKR